MSLPRQDGPDKVTGRTRYAGDQVVAGMLYARLVLSPYAHARILHIDTSAARSMPGVVAVFTAATLGMAQGDSLSRAQSPLAQQEVLWCGHPVAVVVGETEAFAEDGAAAVEVDYEPLPAAIEPEAPPAPVSPPAHIYQEVEAAEEIRWLVSRKQPRSRQKKGRRKCQTVPTHDDGQYSRKVSPGRGGGRRNYRTTSVFTESDMEPNRSPLSPVRWVITWCVGPALRDCSVSFSRCQYALAMPEQQIWVEPVPIGGGLAGRNPCLSHWHIVAFCFSCPAMRLVYTRQDELLAGTRLRKW